MILWSKSLIIGRSFNEFWHVAFIYWFTIFMCSSRFELSNNMNWTVDNPSKFHDETETKRAELKSRMQPNTKRYHTLYCIWIYLIIWKLIIAVENRWTGLLCLDNNFLAQWMSRHWKHMSTDTWNIWFHYEIGQLQKSNEMWTHLKMMHDRSLSHFLLSHSLTFVHNRTLEPHWKIENVIFKMWDLTEIYVFNAHIFRLTTEYYILVLLLTYSDKC